MKQHYGKETEVTLIAGSGGVYEIIGDGALIFSKKKAGRFPEEGEIVGLINQR